MESFGEKWIFMVRSNKQQKMKKEVYDFHFVYSKPDILIQTFINEAKDEDRDMTTHMRRILRTYYQQKGIVHD
jgi:hypothetical protein